MRVLVRMLLGALGAWLGLRAFVALRPTAFPYFAREILDVPRPLLTRRALLEILQPEPGERMLEVGPGTGYYTLAVASRLEPDGIVEILDVRRRFLDHTVARAHRHGLVDARRRRMPAVSRGPLRRRVPCDRVRRDPSAGGGAARVASGAQAVGPDSSWGRSSSIQTFPG